MGAYPVRLSAAVWVLTIAGSGCLSPPRRPPPHWVTLGSARLDTTGREIRVDGFINMDAGVIELLACGPEGKTHESLLVLTIAPADLQTAILLLGAKPGRDPVAQGVGQPDGPEFDLWVEWRTGSDTVRQRAEHLVYHRPTGRALPETGWAFTGSQFVDGRFMAEAEQSLIATYWDPWAILNLPLACGGDDTLLKVNEAAVPPAGTPVTLCLISRR